MPLHRVRKFAALLERHHGSKPCRVARLILAKDEMPPQWKCSCGYRNGGAQEWCWKCQQHYTVVDWQELRQPKRPYRSKSRPKKEKEKEPSMTSFPKFDEMMVGTPWLRSTPQRRLNMPPPPAAPPPVKEAETAIKEEVKGDTIHEQLASMTQKYKDQLPEDLQDVLDKVKGSLTSSATSSQPQLTHAHIHRARQTQVAYDKCKDKVMQLDQQWTAFVSLLKQNYNKQLETYKVQRAEALEQLEQKKQKMLDPEDHNKEGGGSWWFSNTANWARSQGGTGSHAMGQYRRDARDLGCGEPGQHHDRAQSRAEHGAFQEYGLPTSQVQQAGGWQSQTGVNKQAWGCAPFKGPKAAPWSFSFESNSNRRLLSFVSLWCLLDFNLDSRETNLHVAEEEMHLRANVSTPSLCRKTSRFNVSMGYDENFGWGNAVRHTTLQKDTLSAKRFRMKFPVHGHQKQVVEDPSSTSSSSSWLLDNNYSMNYDANFGWGNSIGRSALPMRTTSTGTSWTWSLTWRGLCGYLEDFVNGNFLGGEVEDSYYIPDDKEVNPVENRSLASHYLMVYNENLGWGNALGRFVDVDEWPVRWVHLRWSGLPMSMDGMRDVESCGTDCEHLMGNKPTHGGPRLPHIDCDTLFWNPLVRDSDPSLFGVFRNI